jgi:hypothetical protein
MTIAQQFFTFINPETMEIPLAFRKLSSTRGTDAEGAVPRDTKIIYAIGGYAYRLVRNLNLNQRSNSLR